MICSWKSQPHLFIFSPGAVKGQENGERLIIYHFNKEAEDNTQNYYYLQFSWPS